MFFSAFSVEFIKSELHEFKNGQLVLLFLFNTEHHRDVSMEQHIIRPPNECTSQAVLPALNFMVQYGASCPS